MRRNRSWPLWLFLGWTVFVWAGRIRNGGSVLLAASFLVLAAVALWQRGRWVTALVVWTIGVWVVRTPYILVHDHPVAFKVLHTVLAAVSIALAIAAFRSQRHSAELSTTAA